MKRQRDWLLSKAQLWFHPTILQRIFHRQQVEKRALRLRFMLVGAMATTIDWGLLFTLHFFGWPAIAANFVSATAGFSFSFFLNKNFTFRTKGSNVTREILLYVAVTLIGIWLFQPAVITLVSWTLHDSSLSASLILLIGKILATGVTLIWNYLLYSKVVFHHKYRDI